MDEHFDLDLTYITDRIIGKAYFGGAGLGCMLSIQASYWSCQHVALTCGWSSD